MSVSQVNVQVAKNSHGTVTGKQTCIGNCK